MFGLPALLFFGLLVGLLFGLVFGGLACLQHFVIRVLMGCNGVAPLRYVEFLDEANDLLFLRRTGSGYIFVDRLLLEHFAGLGTGNGRGVASDAGRGDAHGSPLREPS